ncbi:MAG: chemotaxis protein CheR [Ideonella sp. MAG2]|nr:MAG: chemotaxis protein CheR [Ideonella sp. MAG2]
MVDQVRGLTMTEEAPDTPTTPLLSQAMNSEAWVVAVGASAGGLEALQRFFSSLTLPTQAAFVVLQHLAADHRSMMPELLGRHTALAVTTAEEGMALQTDMVYLLPPGVMMTLVQGCIHFEPKPSHGVTLPIDHFFVSLAEAVGEHAVGVVLSGSGSDGALGASALRAQGGYVLVQAPDSAKFDSMPRSALAATQADAVGTPEELAVRALEIVRGGVGRFGQSPLLPTQSMRPALQRVFECLFAQSGIDFNQYKLPTVLRRIERRLLVLSCSDVTEYADRLSNSADERELLRRELLIPVTSFFRDATAFKTLFHQVLVPMVRQQAANRPLRVWSAGCATGEEAYTLGILLLEACQVAQNWPGIKIFATDVDQRVLDLASACSYPLGSAESLGPERTARYFQQQDDRLVIKPELRQMVLFARHNLLDDAPFTKMDLVVCRNTLIYFQADAQERVMRRLQYALNAQGVLFLGSSESLGPLQADFEVLDSSQKIYRLQRPVITSLALHDGFGRSVPPITLRQSGASPLPLAQSVVEAAQVLLTQTYLPACLLINSQRQLLHTWGPAQRFLRVPEGSVNLDALRLLPPRLGPLAAHALQCALRDGKTHRVPPIQVEVDGEQRVIAVVAHPVSLDKETLCVALSLEEVSHPLEALPPSDSDRMATLERELQATRLGLQSTIEELEASNEELQATNEELMSSNEELQSTNEELQSVNEELYTVNAEYNAKLDALSALNADLEGMAQSTGIATLFVNEDLTLVRFTPEATLLFRLRQGDVGRSIEDFNSLLIYPELTNDLRKTLNTGEVVEREIQGPHGSWYLARVLAYGQRTSAWGRRAVLSFIDITRLRDASRLQDLIDSLPEHVALVDLQGTIRLVNRAWNGFARANGGDPDVDCGVGANYLGVLARATTPQAMEILSNFQAVMSGQQPSYTLSYPCHSNDEERWFVMHVRPLSGAEAGVVVTHFDVSPSVRDWPKN